MAWNPPRQGTKARNDMPRDAFLDPENRRYPYKDCSSGSCKISEEGLVAAIRAASFQGDNSIIEKAQRILKRIRGGS